MGKQFDLKNIKSRVGQSIDKFFFLPASPLPLAVLRIGIAIALIAQAIFISPLLFDLYGKYGIMQGAINDFFGTGLPNVQNILSLFARIGVDEQTSLIVFASLYLFSLGALLLGFYTRIAALVVWFIHLVFSQGHTTSYGADTFANIFLFYLIWMPSGDTLSLDRSLGRTSSLPSAMARLSIRVLQIHLCLVYLSSGLDKAAGAQWWDGDAIWRSLVLPVYAQMDLSALSNFPWIAVVLGCGTLLIEICYPLFIFPTRTRRLWVALTLGLHVGIAIFLGLHIFGFVMALFTASVFGISSEPKASTIQHTEHLKESYTAVGRSFELTR